jgi:hypothetical protein
MERGKNSTKKFMLVVGFKEQLWHYARTMAREKWKKTWQTLTNPASLTLVWYHTVGLGFYRNLHKKWKQPNLILSIIMKYYISQLIGWPFLFMFKPISQNWIETWWAVYLVLSDVLCTFGCTLYFHFWKFKVHRTLCWVCRGHIGMMSPWHDNVVKIGWHLICRRCF